MRHDLFEAIAESLDRGVDHGADGVSIDDDTIRTGGLPGHGEQEQNSHRDRGYR